MFWMWYNSVHHSSCLQVWCQDTITVYDTVSQITCMMYGAWSWTYNDCHAFHVNQIKTILQWLSYLIFIFFILQACCYQGNNLRSKQKNQDKRSCFKGSKVYVRLPCIAVKCLIFVWAGHYLLKHLMSQVFITIIVIINLLINLCMNYLMVCRRQISTCVKYYIQTVQL